MPDDIAPENDKVMRGKNEIIPNIIPIRYLTLSAYWTSPTAIIAWIVE